MSQLNEAFHAICKNAEKAKGQYVSLYSETPFFGGQEEGGWWGKDRRLVATQFFPTETQAIEAADKISDLANQMNVDAKNEFNQQCLQESEWLEGRGLDDDFLPEVDGEESFLVYVEDVAGENSYTTNPHYE